jgi:3-oxoacyl-[acyl-carrier-protein] synthase-3
MPCYVVQTASHLPGEAISNADIGRYLGVVEGEELIRDRILAMNGIRLRHYAQDSQQQSTNDVYGLGAHAVGELVEPDGLHQITYLSAGTTYAPLAAPGYASILHSRLAAADVLTHPVEISSNAGICSSASAALMGAVRAIESGDHRTALCVAAEHSSEVIKASAIQPIDDRASHANLRDSQWFMSMFLRFMLSDGAGAMVLADEPRPTGISLRVNWTHSVSLASAAPLCMKLESRGGQLTQDVAILSKHLFPAAGVFLDHAFERHDDSIEAHHMILPHLSSFFFRKRLERTIAERCSDPSRVPPYWTNLATAGNTGAASIYVMLDEYLRTQHVVDGQRLLLFVPESGQFNFVLISLTAIVP